MSPDALHDAVIFRELSDGELEEVRRRCHSNRYPEGARILHEGLPGGVLHVVLEGRVRISKAVPAGGEEALAVLDPGAIFGEVEFLDQGPSSASAIAHSDCTTLSIPHEEVGRLMEEQPGICSKLLWTFARTLAARLRETDDRVGGLLSISRGF